MFRLGVVPLSSRIDGSVDEEIVGDLDAGFALDGSCLMSRALVAYWVESLGVFGRCFDDRKMARLVAAMLYGSIERSWHLEVIIASI